ncbi:MAG: hypothetical protein HOJ73_04540 [Nitrosomonadales bacterium]|jgi:hypothetical protein|nr:hypothetical protein [Nitrosomonadales bacterium]
MCKLKFFLISNKPIKETAMKVLHLICTLEAGSNSKRKGLRPIPGTSPLRFKSGWWDFTVEQIEELMGGKVYLHNTKRTDSFVGGTVVDYKEFDMTPETIQTLQKLGYNDIIIPKKTKRIEIVFQSELDAKGREWEGRDYSMNYSGDIIDVDR